MGSRSRDERSLEVGFRRSAKAPKQPEVAAPVEVEKPVTEPKPPKQPRVRRERAPRKPLGVWPSSIITGLVVGVAIVAVSSAVLDGCAGVRGTDSCGSVGLPLLLLILGGAVALGAAMLRVLARTPSPGSTSFLAVAFVAVVVGLFLLDVVDGWASAVIVPVLSVVGYVGSHWVMTHWVEPVGAGAVSAPDRTGTPAAAEPAPPAER